MLTCSPSWILFVLLLRPTSGYLPTDAYSRRVTTRLSSENGSPDRRLFLRAALAGACAIPRSASAGIDVRGLAVEGKTTQNPDLANQLKAYDGSGSSRVKEIQSAKNPPVASPAAVPVAAPLAEESPLATWALRASPGLGPQLSRARFGISRLNDVLVGPPGSKRLVSVSLEFPSDWLQLDRAIGGIQYVDQRNGDKLYVLRAPLPPNTSLSTLPKSVLGDLIFSPGGSLAKSGQNVEDYKVSSVQILSECPNGMCSTRSRFKIKYATVTPNGLRVERRGLLDAYQVENEVYMLLASSNAVKFEKANSMERETVENIVASFVVEL